MEDFGLTEADTYWLIGSTNLERSWQPEFQGIFGPEDYALVQSHHSVADCTQFEIPAPVSIFENTFFPVQTVAGIEATVIESHDALYVPQETLDDPAGCDEFAYDAIWTPLVLNHSHDRTSIAATPETEEIVNGLSKADLSNDMKSFGESGRKTKSTSQVWTCVICHEEVATYHDLKNHAWVYNHATLKCRVQQCNHVHGTKDQNYRDHLKTSHPRIYNCAQCDTPFDYNYSLERHASESGHGSFFCDHQDCGKTFLRLDTCQRHQKEHQEDAKRFLCKYCKKYQGKNGFKRKDHLTQHLRGYHHIGEVEALKSGRGYSCTELDCSEYRELTSSWSTGHAFTKRPDYVKHMKAVHDTSEFPCPEPGCERVGGKGYFRIADIRAHLKKVHNIADPVINDVDQH